MAVLTARIVLFTIWVIFFVIYIVCTFLPANWGRVEIDLVKETMWKFIYVLFPVLASFAGFWFAQKLTDAELTALDRKRLNLSQIYAMFVFTFLCHGFVFFYYTLTVLSVDFAHLNQFVGQNAKPQSYTQNVDDVIKLLVFLSAAALAPVGLVIKERVAVGDPGGAAGSIGDGTGRQ